MTDLAQRQSQALEPLRGALLARARAEADGLRAAAQADGERTVARGRGEAEALLADARMRGEAEGAELLAAEQTAARRSARAALLGAQRAAYEDLRSKAAQGVRSLLREPENRRLLAAALRHALGDVASVSDTEDGGLFAQAPDGRSIDASIGTLVDGALADLDLEGLWRSR
jgi:vacuolar-type H+-ATPase subunit E/Vma4